MLGVGRRILHKENHTEYIVTHVSQNEEGEWVYWAEEDRHFGDKDTICVTDKEAEEGYYLEMPLHRTEAHKEQRQANNKHHRKSATPYFYNDGCDV